MPADLLARRLHVPRYLPEPGLSTFTPEQLDAIERRDGELLLAAGAGSGKTSVLVERFARSVLEDGIDVSEMLAITFTEKAAAELRQRIRARLLELGAQEAARATESALISTIHGFCARVLRVHALAAGLDPAFTVLDDVAAQRLADAAFDDALEALAEQLPGGLELIASYGAGSLRGAVRGAYAELRSRGELDPTLPALPPAPAPEAPRAALGRAAAGARAELSAIADPSSRVVKALERLGRLTTLLAVEPEPWPGELESLALPGGNGAALTSSACAAYGEALAAFRGICAHRRAQRTRDLLAALLELFGARYAERKRARSGLDFEDLELLTRALLCADPELRERYRTRFRRIMVDELQDTNRVQLELIELVARDNLFTVGDAQQSIYGFRHADVELFERRAERLAQAGARATLQTNFRSRRELLQSLNGAFSSQLGAHFMPLSAGRTDPPSAEPLVELLIVDKGADWDLEGLASPWRLGEAQALADRVRELLDAGCAAREVVVLTRASTDLRTYERALEDRGIPTYVIGGRGYWGHPQVIDLVAYLRALANPRDEEALYTVLASPLGGVSVDALVVLAAAAGECGRDPWWVMREPDGLLDDLDGRDRDALARFADWFSRERTLVPRAGVDELVSRALQCSGYDLAMLTLPGGQRRLANVRKLMRLGREYEQENGRHLRGFLELVAARATGVGARDPRESEAPVESEALDAVRLMTIHRAKGLEFEIVCVADLGRSPRRTAELLRIGRDGRLGLRLAEPGTGGRTSAVDYEALGAEQAEREVAEERRLFYVAMTRARERLILSGAARLDTWTGCPMGWIAPAFVPEIASLVDERTGVTDAGVRFTVIRPDDLAVGRGAAVTPAWVDDIVPPMSAGRRPSVVEDEPGASRGAVSSLSYSALREYERCGYRFYVERVLGVPAVAERSGGAAPGLAPDATALAPDAAGRTATDRGLVLHALLERLDFRRPQRPDVEAIAAAVRHAGVTVVPGAEAVAAAIEAFAASELCARLGRAADVRREQRFTFALGPGPTLVSGTVDVLARERGGRSLVVDYKSDRLAGRGPAEIVASEYGTQRLIYAIAALRAGALEAEIVHVFLEAPDRPAAATWSRDRLPELEHDLRAQADGVLGSRFAVTESPYRAICAGCPAEGGLCSWPRELTTREAPDRLF